jgi:hypothetical protein
MALAIIELISDVMEELGVLAAGQSPSSEDAVIIKRAYTQWLSLAQNRMIVDWYNPEEEIPDGAEHGVCLCICNQVHRKFGVAFDPTWKIEGEAELHDYMFNNAPPAATEMAYM